MQQRNSSFNAAALVGSSDHQELARPDSHSSMPTQRGVTTGSGHQIVSGTVTFTMFQFTSPTTAVSAGVFTGDISGTFTVQYYDLAFNGDGSASLKANHTLTLGNGTIVTQDDIVLLPVDNPQVFRPHARMVITAGTGAYAGAIGQFMVQGEYNTITLDGSLQFKGDIYVP